MSGADRRSMARTVGRALRNAIIHPVPLPIIAGLLFAQTGLVKSTVDALRHVGAGG